MRFTKGRILRFVVDLRQNLRVTCSRRRNVRNVIKMATYLLIQRSLRQQRVFRDRTQPLDSLNDSQLISRYRFPRRVILDMIDGVDKQLRPYTTGIHAIPTQPQLLFSKH